MKSHNILTLASEIEFNGVQIQFPSMKKVPIMSVDDLDLSSIDIFSHGVVVVSHSFYPDMTGVDFLIASILFEGRDGNKLETRDLCPSSYNIIIRKVDL